MVCDPASGVYVVILTNRAHPNDKGTVKAVRKGVTDIVYRALSPSTDKTVQTLTESQLSDV